ncbi:esterase [Halogeometricum borinquense DSM 11551]|uniref:Esterase n=2 Tax=Halogeometricum borinquense TaxID=60847 RepID=E4NPU5_HALBP|nr:alpha/beta fold hydrolase [Halogeometricum borinquense]ADQ66578.1 predicted esterase [Halogeometricum borinquense DSM 11551]ELY30686.1 esterase [Halogeometricum borinquense DSM 11551]RYJ14436.1 alpha/beta fold hydrolase [Halogeometricum borinquense]
MSAADPHADQPILTGGTEPEDAEAVVVLVHGRGATARGMLAFADEFHDDGVHYVAPQAQRGTWYPNSFMAPTESNQPHYQSALLHLNRAVEQARETTGLDDEKIIFVGFSQGACLASSYVAQHPSRYGGVVLLSGGFVGPEGAAFDFEGSMAGTPVFLGVSDDDPHVPQSRAEETIAAFDRMDADTRFDLYEGRGHGIFPEEIEYLRTLVASVLP